ncbi:MAG: hypothetical protein PHN89_04820 [Candidatus Pacebacteria bacterium]|nr:hypothetical protein [Candidatus Paceibacterota bacterium]
METIEQIETQIAEGLQSPQKAADLRVMLSAKYSRECGKLEEILKKKPLIWLEMRTTCKSVTETERMWEGSEMGTDEMIIKLRQKRIQVLISSLSSFLRMKENEAKNQY